MGWWLKGKSNKNQSLYLQEDKVFGGKQHLHHRGFLQKSEGQKNRAAEVYEEDEKEVHGTHFVLHFHDTLSSRNPTAKIALRYDKLMVEKDVYAFNEVTGVVEFDEF